MDYSRRFDVAAAIFVFLVLLLTIYLTKDFLNTILLSIVLVFLLRPLYAVFFRLTHRRQVSSFFSIMIVFIVILGFLVGITTVLLVEMVNLERSGVVSGDQITALTQEMELWAKSAIPSWIYNSIVEIILRYVEEISDIPIAIAKWLLPVLEKGLAAFASNLPVLFAQLVVAVFFTYYILMDGRDFVGKAMDLVPEKKKELARVFLHELNMIYDTLFSVYFTTSMLSGAMAAIGFSLLGLPYPFLMGGIVAVFTLLPMLGPPFVFVPMALYYMLQGDLIRFLILLIFGVVVLMVVPENIIRPHLAMKTSRIHPTLTLLAYTAPVFVVGVMGVIIGPALYGFLLAVYRTVVIVRSDRPEEDAKRHFQDQSKTSGQE
jgi:predicted PurR-regulated permease PerM